MSMPDLHPERLDETSVQQIAHCNCVSLRRAARRISLFYDACLAPVELRATQFSMLAALADGKSLTVNGLAATLDLDRSTAGQNVKLLERDGLMEVVPCDQDRRARVICLTPSGRAKLRAAAPIWQKAQEDFEALNGASVASALRAMLSAIKVPASTSG